MKLPLVKPLEENLLCSGREEFGKVIKRTLNQGRGAFFKVFGKSEDESYYITMLIDDEKILAVEAEDVETGSSLVGKPALEILKDVLDKGPVIVDAFPLTDVDVKRSIVENIEVYNSTPKMRLEDMCPTVGGSPRGIPQQDDTTVTLEENRESVKSLTLEISPKKPRMEVRINAPVEVDPYFRGMVRHMKNVLKSFRVELKGVEVNAKEVRYALGAGTGIHATVRLIPEGELPRNVKEALESFVYREAGEISKDLGKKIVITEVKFS